MKNIQTDANPESIYVNIEDVDQPNACHLNPAAPKSVIPKKRSRCSSKSAAVFLGLLCVVLLILIISAWIKHVSERCELQMNYTSMISERIQLQNSYDALSLERDALQRKLNETENNCLDNWMRYKGGCYYISTVQKDWHQSQQDCLGKGADLMIINSIEEQNFVSGQEKRLWIGLSDHDTEGTWKWVDNTPLQTGFWRAGEPNNIRHKGTALEDEDCAQVVPTELSTGSTSSWNDFTCNQPSFWICEKTKL